MPARRGRTPDRVPERPSQTMISGSVRNPTRHVGKRANLPIMGPDQEASGPACTSRPATPSKLGPLDAAQPPPRRPALDHQHRRLGIEPDEYDLGDVGAEQLALGL